ncbi:MAG: exodeoxyribonuclease VII large subunit [Alphaproteobacteria bacterium]
MPEPESIKSNVPEFSVSELAFSLKKTLEASYARVRVRGELSRVKIHSSGHLYTDLKDADSVINAVCWRGTVSKLSIKPEEGLEVICTGQITTYPARSNYQLKIESMELAGEGALLKMLEERRKRLAAEGLFDPARKKPIPFLPEIIGIVTSPTGAVIQDILHRLEDRFPRHVIVWPVLVQGPGAAEQVAAAINGFQNFTPRPDLLIVARGGGSLEDLMPFNEEVVVRAAAASTIPLIAAVGHETDTTLIDYAADLRAPTPTGAAEKSVPVRAELAAFIADNGNRLFTGLTRMISELRHRLDAQSKGLGDPSRFFDVKTQRLDNTADKIARVFIQYLSGKQEKVLRVGAKLRHPSDRLDVMQKTLERWGDQLTRTAPRLLDDLEKRLGHAGKMLEAYSFENVLQRGFVVVRDSGGHVIASASDIKTGQDIELQFKGREFVTAEVKGKI